MCRAGCETSATLVWDSPRQSGAVRNVFFFPFFFSLSIFSENNNNDKNFHNPSENWFVVRVGIGVRAGINEE